MKDIWVVCKKEIKELLAGYGEGRRWYLQIVIIVAVFGVFMPLSQKEAWLASPLPAAFFIMMPPFIGSGVVADSFAGERERKTLETLLASRLPDRAIFLGKVLSVVIYAWVFTALSFIVSLVSLNLAKQTPGLALYSTSVFVAGLGGSALTGLLIAGIGVFVSLRAKSARAAQQTLGFSMFILMMAVGYGLPALVRALPEETSQAALRWLSSVDLEVVVVGFLLVLGAVDGLLLALGVRRFQRSRLILD
jgi:ABC-2 type transport system permease protein